MSRSAIQDMILKSFYLSTPIQIFSEIPAPLPSAMSITKLLGCSSKSSTMATYVTDPKGRHSAPSRKKKVHNALEDVAEEMLNGMFCHYEPPPLPKQGHRGILRAPRQHRKSSTRPKAVSWSETIDDTKPPVEIRCNIAANCIDGGVAAGILSPSKSDGVKDYFAGYDYDLNQTKSDDSSVPYRPSRAVKDVVYDDQGNPVGAKPGVAAPRFPKRPPPSRKERFIPELCGVRINCCDDDKHMEQLAKSSSEGYNSLYWRTEADYYDADDNSLVTETETPMVRIKREPDWDDHPNSPKNKGRRVGRFSRGKKLSADLIESNRNGSPRAGDDWDTTVDKKSKGWFQRGRAAEKESPGIPQNPTMKSTSSRGRSPGRSRRMSFDPTAIPKTLMRKARSKSPARTHKRTPSFDMTEQDLKETSFDRMEKSSMIMEHRNKFDEDNDPMEKASMIMEHRSQFDQQPGAPAPHLHPAHPLNQTSVKSMSKDEKMERQSYITAHRQAFDATSMVADDLMERQSHIMAHREGFDDKSEVPSMAQEPNIPPPPAQPATSADADRRASAPAAMQPLPIHLYYQQAVLPNGQPMNPLYPPFAMNAQVPVMSAPTMQPIPEQEIKEEVDEAEGKTEEGKEKKVEELSWEERTRQAWERLRNTFATETKEEEKPEESSEPLQPSTATNVAASITKPVSILRTPSSERRVTFGQDREHIIEDGENVAPASAPQETAQAAVASPQMMYPIKTSPVRRTKKKFRGAKILTGMFRRGNNKQPDLKASSSSIQATWSTSSGSRSVDPAVDGMPPQAYYAMPPQGMPPQGIPPGMLPQGMVYAPPGYQLPPGYTPQMMYPHPQYFAPQNAYPQTSNSDRCSV